MQRRMYKQGYWICKDIPVRILYVGHTYMVGVNRKKLDELGRMEGIEQLSVLVPKVWRHYLRRQTVDLMDSPSYELFPANVVFQGHEGAYFYFPDISMHIGRIKPDIIHVEQGAQALSYAQAIASKKILAPSAKCLFFTWWNLPYIPKPYWALVEKYNLRHSDYAIAGNHDAMAVLRQRGFTGPITVLPQLGVDAELYCPFDAGILKRDLNLKGFVVGYVGRFLKQKGLHTLVKAFSQLRGSRTLLLVGRGGLREELLEIADSAGLSNSICFVDTVPHQEIPRYMNCMDVMVLPSLTTPTWKEQFGHVLIEAMACETPVVGSDSGAIPQVIGNAGLVFPEGDVKELTEKLQSLMDDSALRAELALKGRQRVLRKYTHRHIAEEIHHIYQELMSGA